MSLLQAYYGTTYKGRAYTEQIYLINEVKVTIHEEFIAKLSLAGWRLPLCDGRVALLMDFREVVTVAGHDWQKIDPAVPQPWLDERRRHGDKENYCWQYETAPVFGQALAYSTLIREATANIEGDILKEESANG